MGIGPATKLLRSVAKLLRRKMRETDIVARYGGDEFAIIHPDANLAGACKSAQRACESIAKHSFAHDGKTLRVTVSLGVAEVQRNEDVAETVKRADDAMYASKEAGRNCIHFHNGKAVCRLDAKKEPAPARADLSQRTGSREPTLCSGSAPRSPLPVQEASGKRPSDSVAELETRLELPGRTLFCQQVRNRLAEWKRGGPTFSVALIKPCGDDKSWGKLRDNRRERSCPA